MVERSANRFPVLSRNGHHVIDQPPLFGGQLPETNRSWRSRANRQAESTWLDAKSRRDCGRVLVGYLFRDPSFQVVDRVAMHPGELRELLLRQPALRTQFSQWRHAILSLGSR